MKKFRSNASRADWAKRVSLLYIFFSVIGIGFNVFKLNFLFKIKRGEDFYQMDAELIDHFDQLFGITLIGLYIAFMILFIMWYRRAYFNLHQKFNYLQLSEGWAAGAWFVPILNLFRPYVIMKEMIEESGNYLKKTGVIVPTQANKIIAPWWTFFLLAMILGRILWKMQAEDIDKLIHMTELLIVSFGVDILAYFFTWRLINYYAQREKLMEIAEKELEIVNHTSSSPENEMLTI
ncbi:MAG TPA: hypothetical protein DCL81_09790 [Algoriphagus sp.]|nr:hypothetical protein [Algoriphagus sp.]